MKVLIIGEPSLTIIEELVRCVEAMTGEEIVCVNLHAKDVDILTQKAAIDELEPFIINSIERYSDSLPVIKRKGHERPYKYHR